MGGVEMSQYDDRRYERLTDREQRDVGHAMKAARGLPAHTVARIAGGYHRAVDYHGCGKHHIFIDMVEDGALDRQRDDRIVGGDNKWTRREAWWNTFLKALRDEPRPPTRAQRKLAKERAEREEREARQREALGWNVDTAKGRLVVLLDEEKRVREQLVEIREERALMERVLNTLDPKYRSKS